VNVGKYYGAVFCQPAEKGKGSIDCFGRKIVGYAFPDNGGGQRKINALFVQQAGKGLGVKIEVAGSEYWTGTCGAPYRECRFLS
jgi:hypothetical protein